MPYVTSAERFGIEKGMQQGMLQGMQQGMQQGMLQGEVIFLRRLLVRRYGNLPAWVESRLLEASLPQLESWGEALLEAKSLEEVFASGLTVAH